MEEMIQYPKKTFPYMKRKYDKLKPPKKSSTLHLLEL